MPQQTLAAEEGDVGSTKAALVTFRLDCIAKAPGPRLAAPAPAPSLSPVVPDPPVPDPSPGSRDDIVTIDTQRRRIRGSWRSLLFVPADNLRALSKAAERGMDAIILDLEDGVADAAKAACRERLPEIVAPLAAAGCAVIVRVNADTDLLLRDVAAAVRSQAVALMIPKVAEPASLHELAEATARLERESGREERPLGFVALIEQPAALLRLPAIADASRVVAMALGSEDFAREMGVAPSPDCLSYPCQMIAVAAAAAGIGGFGLPASLANIADAGQYAASAALARRMGLTGALCIHPRQVPAINRAFGVDPEQLAWAHRVLAAWHDGGAARGVLLLDGAMIDKPVAERAATILAQDARRST